MDAEVRLLSDQLAAADAEIVKAEEAVAQASDRMKRANAEFSNLMAALSLVFREYDKAVRGRQKKISVWGTILSPQRSATIPVSPVFSDIPQRGELVLFFLFALLLPNLFADM